MDYGRHSLLLGRNASLGTTVLISLLYGWKNVSRRHVPKLLGAM
jgi:hypothetical protein